MGQMAVHTLASSSIGAQSCHMHARALPQLCTLAQVARICSHTTVQGVPCCSESRAHTRADRAPQSLQPWVPRLKGLYLGLSL